MKRCGKPHLFFVCASIASKSKVDNQTAKRSDLTNIEKFCINHIDA